MEHWFRQSIQERLPDGFLHFLDSKRFVILVLILIYFYVLPLNFFLSSEAGAWQTTAFEERDAGVWLKEHGKPSPLIFSASFRPVFYAQGRAFPIETTDNEEILTQLKVNKPDYVVTSERSLKRHPYLKEFTEILQKSPEFELVYEINNQPGYKISIFALK